jgi:hypothetical protein
MFRPQDMAIFRELQASQTFTPYIASSQTVPTGAVYLQTVLILQCVYLQTVLILQCVYLQTVNIAVCVSTDC